MKTRYLLGEGKVRREEKAYVLEKINKLEKLLGNYDPEKELMAEVEIERDRRGFWRLEVMISTPHNKYRVEKKNDSLTEAMDEVEEVLKKQIKRDRKKLKDLRERGGRSIKKKAVIDEKARF